MIPEVIIEKADTTDAEASLPTPSEPVTSADATTQVKPDSESIGFQTDVTNVNQSTTQTEQEMSVDDVTDMLAPVVASLDRDIQQLNLPAGSDLLDSMIRLSRLLESLQNRYQNI